ncbi:hypothetical protein NHX12_000328 [Muraenolepis orangiensis]|uniref:Uncharacterized protein n=1 Tax=Muraenolepis orangiensis TaxID=630683 RepID=A0A9Q0E2C4_9TELE|nr:hypothetical protein NHX12_000328 [Muraenolepis orangiensis]
MSLSIVLSSSRSPPPTDQQYSWSSSQHFDEDTYSTPPSNMKGLSGGRPAQRQLTSAASAHTCGLADCEHSQDHHLHHGESRSPSYLLSPTESCPLDGHHRRSPRSSIHRVGHRPLPLQQHLPPHALRQRPPGLPVTATPAAVPGGAAVFEKQMPVHRDGFHTLQYQRTTTTTTTATEPRNESPGRIRHPVHSSHSLPSGGWWSSDDNLDSDSTYRTPSVMSRHPLEHLSHCYPLDAVQAHLAGDLTLKTSRSNNDV